jgi:hypothetical protein
MNKIIGLFVFVCVYLPLNAQVLTPAFYGNFSVPLRVGDSWKGGWIGYIFKSGDVGFVASQTHGIIVSDVIYEVILPWTNNNNTNTISTNSNIGSGLTNTSNIVKVLGSNGNYAAKAAQDFSVSIDGIIYNDWFLPSEKELVALQKSLTLIQNGSYASTQNLKSLVLSDINNPLGITFSPQNSAIYWSSTEPEKDGIATAFSFFNFTTSTPAKTSLFKVRFCRYF